MTTRRCPMYDDTVSDLLATRPGEHAVTVAPDATVTYAVCLMNHNDVGAVLVMDGARLAGIFTERDVLRRVIEPGLDPSITRVHEVLSEKPTTIAGAELAEHALDVMVEGGFRHLPVVAGTRVEGIVSMRDLTGWLIHRLQADDEDRVGV